MHFLRLGGRGCFASANCPDRRVSNDGALHLVRGQACHAAANLRTNDLFSAATFAILELFSHADDRFQAGLVGDLVSQSTTNLLGLRQRRQISAQVMRSVSYGLLIAMIIALNITTSIISGLGETIAQVAQGLVDSGGEVGTAAGITVREAVIQPDELAAADEVFITGTTREVLAVTTLDTCLLYTSPSPRDRG